MVKRIPPSAVTMTIRAGRKNYIKIPRHGENCIIRQSVVFVRAAEPIGNVGISGEKYFERGNICLAEEKKNGEGKEGEYLAKEKLWLAKEKKNREGRGGKYLEKEKLGHRRKKGEIFGEGKSDGGQTNRFSFCVR